MTKNKAPWNKGKKGIEAGWTEARRRKASRRQKKWMRENRHLTQYNYNYVVGPDPQVRAHYYRFLRAKAQAKFWRQKWLIEWEDYLDLLKTNPGEWGAKKGQLCLTRINTRGPWSLSNTELMERQEAMSRPTKGKKRKRPKGLGKGRHHWLKQEDK